MLDKFIPKLIVAVLAFYLGQESIKYAYDPTTLEKNALAMVEVSYRHGCITAAIVTRKDKLTMVDLIDCASLAKKEKKSTEEIFHDRIWRKY